MKVAIRYYTSTGNTKKLADAIGGFIGETPETVAVPLTEKVDLLFLGSSVYAAGVDASVKKFIADNKDNIGMIVNFSTAAVLPSTYKQVKKIAEENGVAICEKEFHCRGSFLMAHKGRPNEADLKAVVAFAEEVIG